MVPKKKPCPYCGYVSTLRYRPFLGQMSLFCDICGYEGPRGKDFSEAVKLWNDAVEEKEKTKT